MQDYLKSFLKSPLPKSAQRPLCAMVLIGTLAMGTAPLHAQETSLNAPEVLDLDDPFARGINRAADQASDGLSLPEPNGQTIGGAKKGKELLGTSEKRALGITRYRVAALAVTEGSSRGQIFEASNQDVVAGSRPEIPYLRLGTFDDSASARQAAINLKANMNSLIGGHFILRDREIGIDLDIGPLHSVSHSDNYCEIMLQFSNGIVSDCYTVLEYPGYEPLDTFLSSAMLRLSPDALSNILDDGDVFDLEETAKKLIPVKEGDMLGNGVDQVVKITPSSVVLVSDDGQISQLPLDYISEQDFQPAVPEPQTNQAPADAGNN